MTEQGLRRDDAAPRLRVDTHVHFHSCFEESLFLDAAVSNLGPADAGPASVLAAVCLTETSSASWFRQLADRDSRTRIGAGRWRIQRTQEECSLLAISERNQQLAVIAGRQVACREGVEVLALGHPQSIPDGLPIRDVLTAVSHSGALPVVPWGFGKWSGRRGRLIRDLLDHPPCAFALGDNGGRPAALREPVLLAKGRKMGFPILPGTDPFPFAWDSRKVGRFGIEWDSALDADRPFHGLKALVADDTVQGRCFGELETVPAFVRNQIAIQLRRLRLSGPG